MARIFPGLGVALAALAVAFPLVPALAASPAIPPEIASLDAVYIKTPTRTLNRIFYYALDNQGRIWAKPIPGAPLMPAKDNPPEWNLLLGNGLVAKNTRIVELDADEHELEAVSSEGRHYAMIWFQTPKFPSKPRVWRDTFGWPHAGPFIEKDRVAGRRGWGVGMRTQDFVWFEDPTGRSFDGGGGLSTYYFLTKEGNRIAFFDSGLPPDFSHTMCTPEQGAFVAEGFAVSSSTMFVINAYGELFTRIGDFDINGADPMFFTYSYDHKKLADDAIALPSEDWLGHAPIPLTGAAQISSQLTIVLTGKHNADRELRVAGYDSRRVAGYYYKKIFDQKIGSAERAMITQWSFRPVPGLAIDPERLLDPADTDPDAERLKSREPVPVPERLASHKPPRRIEPEKLAFEGRLVADARDTGVSVEVRDFNLDCGPATLRFSADGEFFDVTFHTVEEWYHLKRVNPGRDRTPKKLLGTLQIEKVPELTSPLLRKALEEWVRPYDLQTFAFWVEATEDGYLEIQSTQNSRGVPLELALTRAGKGFSSLAEAREASLKRDDFQVRAMAPSLVAPKPLEQYGPGELGQLRHLIELNKLTLREMQAEQQAPQKDEDGIDFLDRFASLPWMFDKVTWVVPLLKPFDHEKYYYGSHLRVSMPPLFAKNQELKALILHYSGEDLARAKAIIDARVALYGRRYKQLGGRAGH